MTKTKQEARKGAAMRLETSRALQSLALDTKYCYPIKAPEIMPGVVPAGVKAPVLAMDTSVYDYVSQINQQSGFPGFPYLSNLATRAEYRAMASGMSTELTREWIKFTSKQDDGEETKEKIKQIEAEFKRLNVRGIVQKAAQDDCFFGRGQIFLSIRGADASKPLILSPRTVAKGSLERVSAVEAVWTTPSAYNAIDPSAPDFYKPTKWFMLGQEIHASRLLTVITRELPDILKPAFNFAGISLSQLAEPYVDNWLRTRQSVSDLINNFSLTILATDMNTLLATDEGDDSDLLTRANMFTAIKSNKGLLIVDKEKEEIQQVNTPLSGLHELQAQAQEQLCAVSRQPAVILTGISPSGLNASSDGEIRVFYDWIAAQQESFWRDPIETILKVVQLSLFGEIDPDIGFNFVPLYQMTPKELAEIRQADAQAAIAYIDAGVLSPDEERERLAHDPEGIYSGIDTELSFAPSDEDLLNGIVDNDKQTGKQSGEQFNDQSGEKSGNEA